MQGANELLRPACFHPGQNLDSCWRRGDLEAWGYPQKNGDQV